MRSLLSHDEEAKDDDSTPLFCWWRSAPEFQDDARALKVAAGILNLGPHVRLLREMERLALVAPESLDDLKQKLLSYRPGDFWLPAGGIKKEGFDIPPLITILLVGFSGSGKSSLVNLMYSVLGLVGLIPFAQTSSGNSSNSRTMFLKEHNVLRSLRNGFCVYDSRGLNCDRVSESLEEVGDWMRKGVHHHQPCSRLGDPDGEEPSAYRSSRFSKRRVNSVMVVANVAEIYKALLDGDSKPLKATKELFYSPSIRKCNENPILVLTHGDLLTTEERLEGRLKICQFLGISETMGAYDIACLTETGILAEDSDPVTAYSLAEAIYRALLFSDRTHPPKKSFNDYFVVCLTYLLYWASAFFAFLGACFSMIGSKGRKLKM